MDTENQGIVNGTIYLWTHNTAIAPSGGLYVYTSDDYAMYNLTGGTQSAPSEIGGGGIPSGKIASGQAFFIEANSALANGNYVAKFKNSMRVANNNSQYFRTANDPGDDSTALPDMQKDRLWLKLTNDQGAYSEMLLGYLAGATDQLDSKYDGPTISGGTYVSLYSILETNKLAIQGKAQPFNQTDIIPLGYKAGVAGTFSFDLENFEGEFDTQDIYVFDKADLSYHNIKEAPYSFTTTIGTFDDRFELHFLLNEQQLGTHPPAEKNSVYVIKNNKHLEVNTGNFPMASVAIFDLTGKKIYEKSGLNTTLLSTYDLDIAHQVVIVKVTMADNQVISKKVVL
jgi:hypothetical protein